MKEYKAADIRNFAVVGHAAAGKTTLTESMLTCAGVIPKIGSIADGTTVSDYHESEKLHQISVHATLLNCEWLGRKFNILDTPGSADFVSEALTALRVGDYALVVVGAAAGVQAGTEQVLDWADQFKIPRAFVVNQVDKETGSFDRVLADLRERYGKKVFPLSIPLNPGPGFNRVLDVIRNEVISYAADGSGRFTEAPAAGEDAGRVKELHRQLIEYVAEADNALLEKFFEKGELTEDEFRSGIHAAVQAESFIPVFATAASGNIGVARMMDFIAKYASSPVDRETVEAHDALGNTCQVSLGRAEPVAYVFKTLIEPHVGELSFFRVYSGSINAGTEVFNADRKVTERLGQMYFMNGKQRATVTHINAGDIAAAVKLKDTHTGNTLCSISHALTLPKVAYPQPNIHGSLRLKNKGDEDKIAIGLQTLHEEDPTFIHRYDSETRETVISGQGEIHLQVLAERLKRRFNVEIELVEPRIPYRATIRGKADAKYRHKKQTGGAGQFGEVWLRIEPGARDSGVVFTQSLAGQNVDRVYVPSVEKGVRRLCEEGVLTHHRVSDLKVDFYDGKMHDVDSNDISFQIAGYFAFREAFLAARPCLLEPIYHLEIRVPEAAVGTIMGDLSSRRGKIQGVDMDGRSQIVTALVPQREIYRYSTTLRSLTAGRGRHKERFDHYEYMPAELEQKVVAENRRHAEDNGHH